MVGSFSIPAVSYFRCLPLPSGGQVSRSASAPRKRGYTDLRLTLSWVGPEMRALGDTKTSPDLAELSTSAAQCPRS